MNKIIILTITAIIVSICLVTHNTTLPKEVLPAKAPLIIKSNLLGTCRASAITPAVDTKLNIPIVVCKVQL